MGLTIHYSLATKTPSSNTARQLVEQLRQRALDLPFAEVGDVVEFSGDDCNFERHDAGDPNGWLLIQSRVLVERGHDCFCVPPSRVIAFTAWPGEGCEPANFGLNLYPRSINVGRDWRSIRTGLQGWSWHSFCKTQYASCPEYGGVEHFLKCHLAVIKMLDHAAKLSMLESVDDEGEYWEQRDLSALAGEVGDCNSLIGAWADRLKAAFGENIAAEIRKAC